METRRGALTGYVSKIPERWLDKGILLNAARPGICRRREHDGFAGGPDLVNFCGRPAHIDAFDASEVGAVVAESAGVQLKRRVVEFQQPGENGTVGGLFVLIEVRT